MVRLHCIVEGQTEETFVNNVLVKHLSDRGVFARARRVETGRKGYSVFRGGMTSYAKARRDIGNWMTEDANEDARFTTMFDLYALPNDFPCYDAATNERDSYLRVAILEEAIRKDVSDPRFIPYIQLYEFEALLFSDPEKLNVEFFEDSGGVDNLIELAKSFDSPEHIDSGSQTAPSKRIINEIPSYGGRKVSSGPIVAAEIGLPTLRTRCKHFGEWLAKLETLNETELYA